MLRDILDTTLEVVKHPVGAAAAAVGSIAAGSDLIFGLLAETSGAWFGLAAAISGLGDNLAAVPAALATRLFVLALVLYGVVNLVRWVNSASNYLDRNT